MTDKEQPKDVHEAADVQVGVTDMPNRVSEIMHDAFGFARMNLFGSTNFEGHSLNAMIDLVENTKPEELERAGEALWKARDAISAAAKELSEHIDRVEWEGEAGDAFRKWGRNLAKDSNLLADYAEVAGVQITAAGTGLASVRKAMPPRDTRTDKKTVDDIPTPGRVEGNEDYAAALKVEKDRQEAINQMNRLASFYSVSEQTLAASEPPTFSTMPDLGVPKPDRRFDGGKIEVGTEPPTGWRASAPEPVAGHIVPTSEGHVGRAELNDLPNSTTLPATQVGTEIDSVASPTTVNAPSANGPVAGSTGVSPSANAPLPSVQGFVQTGARGPARTISAVGGSRATAQAQGNARQVAAKAGNAAAAGRTGSPSPAGRTGNPSAAGRAPQGISNRPMGATGRAASTGQGAANGRSAGARSPMGRAVSGGMPRAAATNGTQQRSGVTGAGRANGVVGGRPTGTPPSGAGSRVARGTVIGGDADAAAKSARAGSGIGQRGVIGNANTPSSGSRTVRQSAANPDGVVGTPQGRQGGARGLTPGSAGGAGLVGGRSQNRPPADANRMRNQRRDEEADELGGQTPVPPLTDRREQGRSEA
ncbi:hypothetical protein ACIPJS_17575 [Streptomyces sp. NPDC086783]|uniref:hypothetical protein n=1 Tax=Streptomyces sp. NPDC086783 TaxID=3365758 RepID=UPI003830C92E